MRQKLPVSYQLWRHFGTKWISFRLRYAWRQRSGTLKRRLPVTSWDDQPLANFFLNPRLADPQTYWAYRKQTSPVFFFHSTQRLEYQHLFQQWDDKSKNPMLIAQEISAGKLRYFEHLVAEIGLPPDWFKNPFSGQVAPHDLHWSEIADFGFGDIKIIWEPSRFGFVYALVRAYWRTGDERYPALFWQLLEDWRINNPPQQGPNWKCGQETSFRIMAWVFALYGFGNAQPTTPERIVKLIQMIAVSGKRIEANLDYALSQRNNHGISEGMGLWTIGLLFPELTDAKRWQAIGRQVLEDLARDLIDEDGSFAQHSVNYHRLMLHDYLWAIRLGDLNQNPLSDTVRQRVHKAGNFLYQIQDENTGQVPHYGQTDGALILPLDNCDYLDFRPIVQAIHYLSTAKRCYADGAWDEDLLWLFGKDALRMPLDKTSRQDVEAENGGYYTLRTDRSFVFTRCATFTERPGQADMLHVDLWWKGCNIAIDPGTYSYNANPPWDGAFIQSKFHNTITVDGKDQMERAGKFLWLPWLKGQVKTRWYSPCGKFAYWEGEHDGYERLSAPTLHRRALLKLDSESWLILDYLDSIAKHTYTIHWQLADLPHHIASDSSQLTLHTPNGDYSMTFAAAHPDWTIDLVHADTNGPRGWQSPYYAARQPALSWSATANTTSILACTIFSPRRCEIVFQVNSLQILMSDQTFHLFLNENHPKSSLSKNTKSRQLVHAIQANEQETMIINRDNQLG